MSWKFAQQVADNLLSNSRMLQVSMVADYKEKVWTGIFHHCSSVAPWKRGVCSWIASRARGWECWKIDHLPKQLAVPAQRWGRDRGWSWAAVLPLCQRRSNLRTGLPGTWHFCAPSSLHFTYVHHGPSRTSLESKTLETLAKPIFLQQSHLNMKNAHLERGHCTKKS